MPEYIREVVVTIEVATNKQARTSRITLQESEPMEAFNQRVADAITDLMEIP